MTTTVARGAVLELEKQFASMPLCRTLYRFNLPCETTHWWAVGPDGLSELSPSLWSIGGPGPQDSSTGERFEIWPAYNVAELSWLLRGQHFLYTDDRNPVDVGDVHCVVEELTDGGWQWSAYLEGPSGTVHHQQIATTQAEALAKLLEHLIDHELYRGQLS